MKLRSCDNCAVLLDEDKLLFPKDVWLNDGSVDATKAAWNGSSYTAFCKCPVCSAPITATD